MSAYTDIVAVVPVPFNTRDHDRFGIETFRARGFRVKILDVSHISKTRFPQHVEDHFDGLEVTVATTEQELFEYVRANRNALFVDHCDLHSAVFADVRKPFAALGVDCLLPVVNDIPGSEVMKYQTDDGYYPKYIVVASAYSLIRIPPYGPQTKFILAHTLDYDHYLKFREENEQIVVENSLLFIDQYIPFHPDNVELKNPDVDPHHYYGLLRNFFTSVENSLGAPVVIAAHPRSRYDEHPDYFGGRRLVKGDTLNLMAKTRLVMTHGSTALNYAVLFHKPIMLLTTDQLNRTANFFYLKRYEEELGTKAINLDHLPAEGIQVGVSNNHYWLFREKFVKIRNTPERPFWSIVIDAL